MGFRDLPISEVEQEEELDEQTLAVLIDRHSLRLQEATRRAFDSETGTDLGGWCCSSSKLWCRRCGANFLWSGADNNIASSIPKLLGLPPSPHKVRRKQPGELEAALALFDRVADGRKPVARLLVDRFSDEEQALLRAEAKVRLHCAEYTDRELGARVLGICATQTRRVHELVDLEGLARLYERAGLPAVAREVERFRIHGDSRSQSCANALASRYVVAEVKDKMGWLEGVLHGYPLWTTIARYHAGDLRVEPLEYQ